MDGWKKKWMAEKKNGWLKKKWMAGKKNGWLEKKNGWPKKKRPYTRQHQSRAGGQGQYGSWAGAVTEICSP